MASRKSHRRLKRFSFCQPNVFIIIPLYKIVSTGKLVSLASMRVGVLTDHVAPSFTPRTMLGALVFARHQAWHDRCVDYAQAFDPAQAQPLVDDRHRIAPHLAAAGLVVGRVSGVSVKQKMSSSVLRRALEFRPPPREARRWAHFERKPWIQVSPSKLWCEAIPNSPGLPLLRNNVVK